MSALPLVSVVVPTRNSAASLRPCLQSIIDQSYPHVETVVVDNHSTDATVEIARSMASTVLTQGPERSVQRNAGARVAKGSYLVFIDSDMVLAPAVIERCIQGVQANPALKGLIIPEESVGEGFWARCKALERSCYVGDDSVEAARFFRRDVFERTGGYDELLNAGED